MKIAFFGLPLGALLLARDGHDVALAVLSPTSAPGARRLRREIGAALVLEGRAAERLDRAVDAALVASRPDLVVSWFWTRRLPAAWLGAAPLGAIGVHPSLLPRHRGPDPFFWAIDQGDVETGVSVHRLEAEYDTGAVLATRRIAVGTRNAWQLARALDRPSLAALRAVVREFAEGRAPNAQAQDPSQVTWAPAPGPDELRVDWTWSSERVARRVRALGPVPGLELDVDGLELVVMEVHPTASFVAALLPGEAAASDGRVSIRTGDGAVSLEKAVLAAEPDRALDGRALHQLFASRPRAV